jgi:hypothetical protein
LVIAAGQPGRADLRPHQPLDAPQYGGDQLDEFLLLPSPPATGDDG